MDTPKVNAEKHQQVIKSEQLLGKNQQVQILHNGEIYTLRKTKQGKLILTK